MTSRERVIAAFKHEYSAIVPRWCGASDEFWNKAKAELNLDDEELRLRFGDDFRRISAPYVHPVDLPEEFTAAGELPLPEKWWEIFGDKTLNDYIERSLGDNFDLLIAWDRLAQAQALARRTGINLAAVDFVFPLSKEDPTPLFLEINYYFGRRGLGGMDAYYRLLFRAIQEWLKGMGLNPETVELV